MDTMIKTQKGLVDIFCKLQKVIPIKHDVVIAFNDSGIMRFTWFFKINKKPYSISQSISAQELKVIDSVDFIEQVCHKSFVQFQEIKNSIK